MKTDSGRTNTSFTAPLKTENMFIQLFYGILVLIICDGTSRLVHAHQEYGQKQTNKKAM